jgi:hypothetical protein
VALHTGRTLERMYGVQGRQSKATTAISAKRLSRSTKDLWHARSLHRYSDSASPPQEWRPRVGIRVILVSSLLLDQGGNLEVMTDALQAAYDLIDATAGELGVIGVDGTAS